MPRKRSAIGVRTPAARRMAARAARGQSSRTLENPQQSQARLQEKHLRMFDWGLKTLDYRLLARLGQSRSLFSSNFNPYPFLPKECNRPTEDAPPYIRVNTLGRRLWGSHYESRPSPSFLPYPPLRKIIYFTKSLQLNVTTIYTDGSQSSEGVGAGVILPPPLQTIQLKLHQECSAFQAELLAILYATKITMNFPKEHFIIASDCQSALSAICRSWPPKIQLIAEIIYNLHFSPNVQLCWFKGHSGIPGNELADQAAKAAAHSNLPLFFTTLPKSVARGKKEQIAFKMWTDLYIQDYSTRNLRRFAATPKLLLQMLRNIKHGSTFTTILTGHGYIQADLATVSKEYPICPHYQDEDQTVDHLLFTFFCPTFQYQRFQTATLLGITNICPASLENLPRKKSAWRHIINWTSTGIVYKSKKTQFRRTSRRSRTPRRIPFTKEVNETLEGLKAVSPDEFLLIGKGNSIVQYYQQLKEYDEKIEIEMVNAKDYDEQERFKKVHEDKDSNNDEKIHFLLQAMIPGSRAHRLLGSYTNNVENYEIAIRALKSRFGCKNV
ncbi:hypothetical protein LAZ67_14002116 [Cordylochernes scorpioides]|uniref:ribonuclease H n=1 Tax=Cordylochernes scorpioides TaxID=51811 RepID=A0ABY6L6P7_9ARAC|nr:hypothetical protein LAZ67_14002116 [Cordylochernes scorpioides]